MSVPSFVTKNLYKTQRLLANNSPAILSAIGVVGVIGTAVLTQKGTVKATRVLDNAQYQRNIQRVAPAGEAELLTKKERALLTWKCYVPAVGVASLSVAAIIGANYINTKRMAALAAGYVLLENKHEEYRDKVMELIGEKKAKDVDDSMAQALVSRSVIQEVVIAAGDVPCVDALSGKVFSSNMETIRKAVNDINERIVHGDQPSVTDLYALLKGGLKETRLSDAFGWNDENMCEPKITTMLDDAGVPVLVMDFSILPVGNFWKVGK